MNTEEFDDRIADLFAQAKDLSGEEQARFLEEQCRNDPPDVRQGVEKLVAADRRNLQAALVPEFGVDALLQNDQTPSSMDRSADETSMPAPAVRGSADRRVESTTAYQKTIGKYPLIRELGGGGQGTTWLVHDPDLDCRVVLKRYHESGSDTEYFLRLEARALAKIQSPHVARCLHVDRIANDLFLVMEFIQGDALDVYVRREQADFERIAQLLAEAAKGLLDVHNAGLLHRDLKPANILVRRNGTPCLVDFGLAVPLGTEAGEQLVGTVPYMSPEQARREALRPSSDVFGLGAVMYELLTGLRPYSGQSGREVLEKAKRAAYRPPLEVNPEIPASLASICLKAMAAEPAQRYATADTFRAALREFLDKTSAPTIHYAVASTTRREGEKTELGPNPYQGLAAFTEADADRFFGRNAQIDRLWRAFAELHDPRGLRAGVVRLLPILGPSGSGKSSLARAGLLARLARHSLPNRESSRFLILTPGGRPLESLATALAKLATGDSAPAEKAAEFERILRTQDPAEGSQGLRRLVDLLPKTADSTLVMLVDQFEELFSLCQDESERRLYIENLLTASMDASRRFSTILTLRSDFLADTQNFESLNQIIADRGLIVPAMNSEELRDAIAEPAKRAGKPLDDGTIELLIAETRDHEGALPLLQFALTRIWEGLRNGRTPAITLHEIGGVGGALAGEAQRIYDSLNEQEQRIARRAFLAMIQLGEGAKDTRRRTRVDSVATANNAGRQVRDVVSHFSAPAVRLVTLSSDLANAAASAVDMMEVTHEALFEHWSTLRSWLDGSRDDIRLHRRLEDAARRWDEHGRPRGMLWRQPELDLLRKLHSRATVEFAPLESAFFRASEVQHRHERVSKWLASAAITLAILLGVVLWRYAVNSSIRSREAILLARSAANELASTGIQKLRPTQPTTSAEGLLDFVRALETVGEGTPEYEFHRQAWEAWYGVYGPRLLHVLGHDGPVLDGSYSPGGALIATASADGRARIWSAVTGELVDGPIDAGSPINSVAFSPDGTLLVTASEEGDVRVWDVKTRLLSGEPLKHNGPVWTARFSSDGRFLATGGKDGEVHVWSVEDRSVLDNPFKVVGEVRSIAFHPKKPVLACFVHDFNMAPPQGRLLVFDLEDDEEPIRVPVESVGPSAGPQASAYALAFSPDGDLLAAGAGPVRSDSAAASVVLVQAGRGFRRLQLSDRSRTPLKSWEVAFSPCGKYLAASGTNEALIRLYHTEATHAPHVLWEEEVTGDAWSLAFSPDSQLVVAGTWDGEIVLFNAATGERATTVPMKHHGRVWRTIFSPDGRQLLSCSEDGTARVWNVDPHVGWTLPTGEQVVTAAMSDDGRFCATVEASGNTRFWEIASSPRFLGEFPAKSRAVDARFLGANHTAMIAFADGSVRSFRLPSMEADVCIAGAGDAKPRRVELDGGGRNLLIHDADGTIRWWDTIAGAQTATDVKVEFEIDRDRSLLERSADGKYIAYVEKGRQNIYLHNVAAGTVSRLPVTVKNSINAIAFNRRGTLLAVGSWDATIQFIDPTSPSRVWKRLAFPRSVTGTQFSLDDRFFIATSEEGFMRVWNAETWRLAYPPIDFRPSYPRSPVVTRDGRSVFVVSDRGEAAWFRLTDGVPLGLCDRNVTAGFLHSYSNGWFLNRTGNTVWIGQRLVTSPRDIDEIRVRTQLALGVRRGASGEIMALSGKEWASLRSSEVGALAAPSREDRAQWHLERALRCSEDKNEFGRRWNLDRHFALATEDERDDLLPPELLYSRAEFQLDRNELTLAGADVEETLEAVPAYYPALLLRARLSQRQGDLGAALLDLRRVAQSSPRTLYSHSGLECVSRIADQLVDQGDYDEAALALKIVEDALKNLRRQGYGGTGTLFELARLYAHWAEIEQRSAAASDDEFRSEEHRSAAVAALSAAVKSGYDNHRFLDDIAEFRVLKDVPAFQQLVSQQRAQSDENDR